MKIRLPILSGCTIDLLVRHGGRDSLVVSNDEIVEVIVVIEVHHGFLVLTLLRARVVVSAVFVRARR